MAEMDAIFVILDRFAQNTQLCNVYHQLQIRQNLSLFLVNELLLALQKS